MSWDAIATCLGLLTAAIGGLKAIYELGRIRERQDQNWEMLQRILAIHSSAIESHAGALVGHERRLQRHEEYLQDRTERIGILESWKTQFSAR